MSVRTPDAAGSDVQPALLQTVVLLLPRTAGAPFALETRVLDIEPQPDGLSAFVVTCPSEIDPREHHFDATLTWTYPHGRMRCSVHTRPGQRAYGDVWVVYPGAQPTRIQERAFFRAKVSVPLTLTWTPEQADQPEREEAAEAAEPEVVTVTGHTLDLGEGGLLALVVPEPPAIGVLVEATLVIDGTTCVQAARVVRRVPLGGNRIAVGLTFLDPRPHGDRFRRFVFEVERRRQRPR